jgi:putative hydrolase of the HAD superfamily
VIRVVVFDADDTLLDFRASMVASLSAVLPQIHALTPAARELTIEDLDAEWAAVERENLGSLRDTRRESFRRSLERLGVTDESVVDRIDQDYYAHRLLTTRAYPDAEPTLQALGADYRLGYATNGNSEPERAGLGGYFAFQIFARVDGLAPKPSRQFFDRVIECSRVHPEEIAYVGDDWNNDVMASTAAGLTAIWLNRAETAERRSAIRPNGTETAARLAAISLNGSETAANRPGYVEINSLSQLPAVLAATAPRRPGTP